MDAFKVYRVVYCGGLPSIAPKTVSYVVIARDGETWLLARPTRKEPWVKGTLLDVTLTQTPLPLHGGPEWIPQWHSHGVVASYRYEVLRPADVVCKLFSDTVGNRLFPGVPECPYQEQDGEPDANIPFRPTQFTDAPDFDATRKSDIANRFLTFAMHAFSRASYTPELHEGLSRMFGLERKENVDDFHRYWFGSGLYRFLFARRITQYPVAGDPSADLSDVEHSIQYIVIRYVMRRLWRSAMLSRSKLERRLLLTLLRRHGMPAHLQPQERAV